MENTLKNKVVLITGGAKRIGATVVQQLHRLDMNIALHYRHSKTEAEQLQQQLQTQRPDSVLLLSADLRQLSKLPQLIQQIIDHYGRLDVLINNASSFYPTPLAHITEQQWEDIMTINLKVPLFLTQAALPYLTAAGGCIINLVDIHAYRPLKAHSLYSTSKAGLLMLTQTLAREVAPQVRVNAIAPGAILWPEHESLDEVSKQRLMTHIALKRLGDPLDIAQAVVFLIRDAPYMTGQVMTIDGGRSLNQ